MPVSRLLPKPYLIGLVILIKRPHLSLSHAVSFSGPPSTAAHVLPFCIAALSRVCSKPKGSAILRPYLGLATAIAMQALDPAYPHVRQSVLQPVTHLVRAFTAKFPMVAWHGTSLLLAVGNPKSLARPMEGDDGSSRSSRGVTSGVTGVTTGYGSSTRQQEGEKVSGKTEAVPAVAVFNMNAGAEEWALLLPVLHLPQQQKQQQQQQQGHIIRGADLTSNVGEAGAGLVTTAAAFYSSGVAAGRSTAFAAAGAFPAAPGDMSGGGKTGGEGGGQLLRQSLGSNTMTRAEAALYARWFGGDGTEALVAPEDGFRSTLDSSSSRDVRGSGGVAGAGGSNRNSSRSTPLGVGAGLLHQGRSPYHPSSAATAGEAVLIDEDVAEGVAAVAFNPAGDAVAAFVLPGHCVVVWRLQSSWTQKLVKLRSLGAAAQLPWGYMAVPPVVHAVVGEMDGGDGQGQGGGGKGWQLQWQSESHVDVYWGDQCCASIEV